MGTGSPGCRPANVPGWPRPASECETLPAMPHSIVQLGRSRADDVAFGERVGGDGQRFLVLAQRILWGTDQTDLVSIDVPKTVRKMTRGYPRSPAAHLLAAYGLRQRDRAAAEAALIRARELCGPDHPDTYLLPSEDEWNSVLPEQRFQCLVPDRIWRATSYTAVNTSRLARENTATILRTAEGSLVIVNPIEFADPVRGQVAALGDVRALVVQGKGHSRGIVPATKQFPNAETWGTRAHGSHPPARHLKFDRLLDEGSPTPEVRVLPVRGAVLEEFLLHHEPTGILIAQDLIQASFRAFGRPYANNLYSFGFGLEDRAGLMGYLIPLITDLPALQSDLAQVAQVAPRGLVGAHYGLVEGDGLATLNQTQGWITTLTVRGHRRLLLRYFANQPAFLVGLLRYKLTLR